MILLIVAGACWFGISQVSDMQIDENAGSDLPDLGHGARRGEM